MEHRELGRKLAALRRAVNGWQALADEPTTGLTLVQIDGIQNGLLQKFEYCWEMNWKTIRKYLLDIQGENVNLAKESIKKLFLLHKISEQQFEILEKAQKDRNAMSHIYDSDAFNEIIARLPQYLTVFQEILTILEEEYENLTPLSSSPS